MLGKPPDDHAADDDQNDGEENDKAPDEGALAFLALTFEPSVLFPVENVSWSFRHE